MSDFFDLPEETVSNTTGNATRTKTKDPNIYDPDPNSNNGKYTSVGRLVPYLADKTKTKYTKYTAKFWNPLTRESLYVDCPSNLNEPSIVWTVGVVIGSLRNEEPVLYKELDNKFGRWFTHISPIYIKKDPQQPDLEGTVKLYKFKKQIDDLIEANLHPAEIDGIATSEKVNPYHMLQGKDILFQVTKKTKEYRDWTKCKFMDAITPFSFKIGDKTVVAQNDPKVVKLINEFLLKNTPDMTPYLHQPWTEDTYVQVAEAIIALLPKNLLNIVLTKSKDEKTNALIRERIGADVGTTSNDPTADDSSDLNFEETPASESAPKTAEPATATVADDDYDELFKDVNV